VREFFIFRLFNPFVLAYRTFLNGLLAKPLVVVPHSRGDNALIIIGTVKGEKLVAQSLVELERKSFKNFLMDSAELLNFSDKEIGVDES
jgi:hypothetical protein